jgi:hypothetical protein
LPLKRRLTGLQVGDDPRIWTAMGFAVVGSSTEVGGVRIDLAPTAEGMGGVRGWSFEPPWSAPIDGLPGCPPVRPAPVGAHHLERHTNGAIALDHVVVASPDVERTTAALAEAGIEPRRTIVGARGDDDVLYRFLLLGTCLLELIGPAAPADDGPARFVGLAFTTATIDDLGDLAGPPRPAVQPGRRIATVRRELGASVPIAFLTPRD